ncbi:MAG: transporter substrate-binding domain-containing protein [Chlamydiota bacterium]|nr:transporter substrate-binding domain-containing protein [Chlamydiota bacterium]
MNIDSKKVLILSAIIALVVSLVGVKLFSNTNGTKDDTVSSKSTLATVLDRKEIRVGYVVYPPDMIKDPNTGELSGIFHDALEKAASNLGLKVNWVEEVGWGTMIEGLKAGRYDMVGSSVWPNSPRAVQADFTIPLTYSLISVAARIDDTRFDKSYDALNSPDVKISIIDGELTQSIVKEQFPNMKVISLPQLADKSQFLLDVSTRKADVAFVPPLEIDRFLKNNPDTIKIVQPKNPLRVYGNVMMFLQGQEAFKSMLNVALTEEINSGYIDSLVKKYQTSPNSFYPVAKPFELPQ